MRGAPRCRDPGHCLRGVTHGSGVPEIGWRDGPDGQRVPIWWEHGQSWSDVEQALDQGALVFTYSGLEVTLARPQGAWLRVWTHELDGSIDQHVMILPSSLLIPSTWFEQRENEARESVLRAYQEGAP